MPRKPRNSPNPPGRPKGYPAFARITRAREAFAQQAEAYVKLHKKAATVAAARGNSAPVEYALGHIMAIDEHGQEQRIVAPSVDRAQIEKGGGTQILIGGGWGGPAAQPLQVIAREVKALPDVIDVESE